MGGAQIRPIIIRQGSFRSKGWSLLFHMFCMYVPARHYQGLQGKERDEIEAWLRHGGVLSSFLLFPFLG